jgi:hypothetical protein
MVCRQCHVGYVTRSRKKTQWKEATLNKPKPKKANPKESRCIYIFDKASKEKRKKLTCQKSMRKRSNFFARCFFAFFFYRVCNEW